MKWSRYVWNDCWVQASREVKNSPKYEPGVLFYIIFGGLFLYIAYLFMSQGGFGVLMGIAVLGGLIRSFTDR